MRLVMALCVVVIASGATAAPVERTALQRARAAYNQGYFDAAIGAARTAMSTPGDADAARLVLARALLERYREHGDTRDLDEGRDTLSAVDPAHLTQSDRGEWLLGYGQWLFITERYGAAAELFEDASSRPLAGGDLAKDKVLDWWASALERHAQTSSGERDRIFTRVYDRMDAELKRDPGSVAANYWLVASARALGELDRAWNASMAGWVRASMAGSRGDALRTDIDRLVLTGIIPDRARAAAAEGHNQRQAADTMVTEWERFKQEWVSRPAGTADRGPSL
jgi:hypothetical protein